MQLAAPRNNRCDQVGHDGLNGPDGDSPAKARMIAKLSGGVFDLKQNAAGAFEKGCPGFSEDGLAPQAVEKLVADLLFKIHYLLT